MHQVACALLMAGLLANAGAAMPNPALVSKPIAIRLSPEQAALVRRDSSPKPIAIRSAARDPDGTEQDIKTEGFEAAWPNDWILTGNPTWDDRSDRLHTGGWGGYCVGGGSSFVAPPGPYPDNVQARMIYGPFDLSNATAAGLRFWAWTESEQEHDWLGCLRSADGGTFYGIQWSGNSFGWQSFVGNPDMSGYVGDDSVWIMFQFASDGNGVAYEGGWLDDIQLWKALPELSWAGTTGYTSDGVDPFGGFPTSTSSPTTFTFKVKYTDASGKAPQKARLLIQNRECDGWRSFLAAPMSLESGNVATGAIYSYSTQLPNRVFKYRFLFRSWNGVDAPGAPNVYEQGPLLVGAPKLCWSGRPGFETDGVEPNSGKGKFKFQVRYRDSWGDAPDIHEVIVRNDGSLFKQKPMATYGSTTQAMFRAGKYYTTTLWITQPGAYEYRFRFHDIEGYANGTPATWQTGPTITTSSSGVSLTGLAALPTAAGAQVTFTLSDDAAVTATVLNVAGRPVRALAVDRPLESGMQTLLWDRKADSGLSAPAGLYMIRMTAKTADGQQTSSMATVALR